MPDKYTGMQETDTDDVNVRTELNVQNSDATLILSHGELFGGSAYTENMASPAYISTLTSRMRIGPCCWSGHGYWKCSLGC